MMTTKEVEGTLKYWGGLKEGKGFTPYYKVLHLEEDKDNYGHRITAKFEDELHKLSDPTKPGMKVRFRMKQNGQYWNYVPGSFEAEGEPAEAPKEERVTYAPKEETATGGPLPTRPTQYDERQASINFHADLKAAIEIYDRLLKVQFENFAEAGEELSQAVHFIRNVRNHHLSEQQRWN